MSVIKLKEISRVYGFGDASTVALEDVSLEIAKGEFVAIMGPSGSGKSTLMNLIGMLDRPTHGDYLLDGRKISRMSQKGLAKLRREKVGFIFQSFNLLPRLTAIDNVALPLTYKGMAHVKRLELAASMLENVGLKERQYYLPNQLSGGQVQRVAVARALVNKPSIVLADEPTGNLDTASSIRIMELLKEIHEAGNTIVMVTHNPELAEYAERFVLMRDGTIETDTKDYQVMLDAITKHNRQEKQAAQQKARAHEKESLKTVADSEDTKQKSAAKEKSPKSEEAKKSGESKK